MDLGKNPKIDRRGLKFGILPKYLPTENSKHVARFVIATNPSIIIEMYREEVVDSKTLDVLGNMIMWKTQGDTEYMAVGCWQDLNDATLKETLPLEDVNRVSDLHEPI